MIEPNRTANRIVILSGAKNPRISLLLLLVLALFGAPARAQQPTGQSIYSLTQQFLAVAPKRFNGSPGHLAAESFIKEHFKPEAAKGNFETDQFTANTPAGPQTMRNYIVRFPAKKTASSSWPATTRRTTRCATSRSSAPTTGPAPPPC